MRNATSASRASAVKITKRFRAAAVVWRGLPGKARRVEDRRSCCARPADKSIRGYGVMQSHPFDHDGELWMRYGLLRVRSSLSGAPSSRSRLNIARDRLADLRLCLGQVVHCLQADPEF